jgi:hypothetical protein
MRLTGLWWWIDRWRESVAYHTLSLGEQGLHRELINRAIVRGGWLPHDRAILQRATGTTAREWSRYWPAVSRFWTVVGERIVPGDEVRLYVSRYRRLPPLIARARRRDVPRRVQRAVFARDGRVCGICGATDRLELDHVIPWSAGGPETVENLRVLCKPCNVRRGAPQVGF